jgi:hypothetical protein
MCIVDAEEPENAAGDTSVEPEAEYNFASVQQVSQEVQGMHLSIFPPYYEH